MQNNPNPSLKQKTKIYQNPKRKVKTKGMNHLPEAGN